MRPDDSWVLYTRKIQEYLDSDECLVTDLILETHGRILKLSRYGTRDDSDMALQCLQSAVEYADLSWYEPDDSDLDWDSTDFDEEIR